MIKPDLDSLSVLVVDDEPSIREALEIYLNQIGIGHVTTAQNGIMALEALIKQHYDYVFMDLMMPKMGGMEVLKNLSHDGRPTSVIVMTGYPSMEKVIEAMRNGASDFLVKPFRLQDIKVSIERIQRLHALMKKNWMLNQELEQKRQVENLNDELQKKIREKTALYNIIDSLSKISHSEGLYKYLVQKGADACVAKKACFLIHDPGRSSLLAFTQHGFDNIKPGLQVGLERTPEGHRIIDRRFVRTQIADAIVNPVYVDRKSCFRELIAIPFQIRQEPFGILLVADKEGTGCFNHEDELLLTFLTEKAALSAENMALYDNLKENLFATLGALVSAIEARDLYTQQHSARVTQFALEIAHRMGCAMEDLRRIESSGPLHDIGKIGIDDHILKKPGNLTRPEFEKIKTHPLIGVNIVMPLGLDKDEIAIIRNHHERWDGGGYPDALFREHIPMLARILAVADAFDAMNSDRAYRKALPFDACSRELARNSGSQFDPQVVEAALKVLDEKP
jgi:putative nucleotidyltransferase with HDIG domain